MREETSSDQDEPVLSMKTLSRGASGNAPKLETVQESSQPATPGIDGSEADRYGFPRKAPLFCHDNALAAARPEFLCARWKLLTVC